LYLRELITTAKIGEYLDKQIEKQKAQSSPRVRKRNSISYEKHEVKSVNFSGFYIKNPTVPSRSNRNYHLTDGKIYMTIRADIQREGLAVILQNLDAIIDTMKVSNYVDKEKRK